MSGIAGFVRLDGAAARADGLARMTDVLAARGPDASGAFLGGPAALGHRALHALPEAALDRSPVSSGHLTVTADVRLDNRAELAAALGRADLASTGDAALILRAYEAWGDDCARRLLGDFAFAIWDARDRRLFCARDGSGARPFVYGRSEAVFAFASDTRALHALGELPRRLSEGRIADFLVDHGLETIDSTSTFYLDLFRLPPGHTLTVANGNLHLSRFWAPEPREVVWSSHGEVVEAFRDTFTEAVRCRVRGDAVGSMLSGGLDSSCIVAVAKGLSDRPFRTFSAIGDDPSVCPDRAYVEAALAQGGLDPTLLHPSEVASYAGLVERHFESTDDPFDAWATAIPLLMYATARRRGVRAVLDGVDGDLVTSQRGGGIRYALRAGRLGQAWRNARNNAAFFGVHSRAKLWFEEGVRPFVWLDVIRPRLPDPLLNALRGARRRRDARAWTRDSIARPSFARKVDIGSRIDRMNAERQAGVRGSSPGWDHAGSLAWAATAVGLERYDRVAASQSVETSHPFLDRRLVELCLSIPWDEKTRDGIPKALLRSACEGVVAEPIRNRGWSPSPHFQFTEALLQAMAPWVDHQLDGLEGAEAYVDATAARTALRAWRGGDTTRAEVVLQAAVFAAWLRRVQRDSSR